jgi:hypothetical protein
LNDKHTEALAMCHAGRDEMIVMQRIAAYILLSVEAEFHTIFELSYTNSSTIDIQGRIHLKVLMIKFYVRYVILIIWPLHALYFKGTGNKELQSKDNSFPESRKKIAKRA